MYIGQPIIDNVCNYNSYAACNLHIYLLSRDSNKENIPQKYLLWGQKW